MSGEIPSPYAKRISFKVFLSVMVSCSRISLMEDGHVVIGQKMYPSRRCLRFSRLAIRCSLVNVLSSSSILRCCPSLMHGS